MLAKLPGAFIFRSQPFKGLKSRSVLRSHELHTVSNPLRAKVFVDGTWLYYNLINQKTKSNPFWGNSNKVDWSIIPKAVSQNLSYQIFQNTGEFRFVNVVKSYVYTSQVCDSVRTRMFDDLEKSNFEVHRIPTVEKYHQEKCVDISLGVEMLYQSTLDEFDIAIILSGDKDYIPAIEKTKLIGKQVALCSLRGSCNRDYLKFDSLLDYKVIWINDFEDFMFIPSNTAVANGRFSNPEELLTILLMDNLEKYSRLSFRDANTLLSKLDLPSQGMNGFQYLRSKYDTLESFYIKYRQFFDIEFDDDVYIKLKSSGMDFIKSIPTDIRLQSNLLSTDKESFLDSHGSMDFIPSNSCGRVSSNDDSSMSTNEPTTISKKPEEDTYIDEDGYLLDHPMEVHSKLGPTRAMRVAAAATAAEKSPIRSLEQLTLDSGSNFLFNEDFQLQAGPTSSDSFQDMQNKTRSSKNHSIASLKSEKNSNVSSENLHQNQESDVLKIVTNTTIIPYDDDNYIAEDEDRNFISPEDTEKLHQMMEEEAKLLEEKNKTSNGKNEPQGFGLDDIGLLDDETIKELLSMLGKSTVGTNEELRERFRPLFDVMLKEFHSEFGKITEGDYEKYFTPAEMNEMSEIHGNGEEETEVDPMEFVDQMNDHRNRSA